MQEYNNEEALIEEITKTAGSFNCSPFFSYICTPHPVKGNLLSLNHASETVCLIGPLYHRTIMATNRWSSVATSARLALP